MPAADGTLTPQDVAAHLGVPVDDRMEDCTDAARQWAQDARSLTPPDELWFNPSIHLGGVLYAAALYQSRVTPEGMAGYDPGVASADSYSLVWRAKELVGSDPVIA